METIEILAEDYAHVVAEGYGDEVEVASIAYESFMKGYNMGHNDGYNHKDEEFANNFPSFAQAVLGYWEETGEKPTSITDLIFWT
ncbi:MAG: hypothetical protein LBQ39_07785 [Tannerellaceae bacterium]|jgi:hypothetical protein|nr:hypothetical protein [Tannerellaceae bacterium]